MPQPQRVIVGISGGVDSAVAALLLQEQGFDVQGLFMKNWEDDDTETYCSAEEDLADAKQVCDTLGIPLHQANFAKEYKQQVFDYCLEEFRAGRTPNPDILCNQQIKFRAFLDYALRLGADYVATGHYVRKREDSLYRLLKGKDDNKDQSYFLYTLGQEQLKHALFPLGELEKPYVRQLAEEAGFDNFAKKDSTGICFIGERDFREFLSRYLPREPGDIVTPEGEAIGTHQGLSFYTIGQRQGLGIGGRAGAEGRPWYVVGKDMQRNALIVAQGHDHPLLLSAGLDAEQLTWTADAPPSAPLRCSAKTRYRQSDQECELQLENGIARLRFDKPQRAVTPGQSVVFYSGEECLGGGIIVRGHPLDN
ncbi:tRNA 2-thiouridine(34) synthase MnmA [Alkalilimnicola ehrlichii]|uniref:tRNA-specific 2-thiouridylase MnmA n=1 Tax=Alkalilimnicola ehrlichii TaxID=351052 RepID=A0A3E0X1F2_9GAMM|nr:tRNA 2-thiouridine(34) synthase MnmA [Alkalilimnicola ehrlichii]RFA28379.1 tRNA 2-thiouridine(34) synthase MnmA [Alkalilimnicola ehrlichii]RFA38556.1 tRNA 2-thiouridine(34) synthase MnmA [Alkalilimnicola ehrlichii]